MNASHFLSFVYPQQLERLTTKYNHDIRVQIEKGEPKLLVNGSRQSGKYIHGLWAYAMHYFSLKPTIAVNNILVLGVAGGTVIHLLHELYPIAMMTGIDIDRDMIRIGKTYFGLDEVENLSLHESDAEFYVKKSKNKYDLIVIDLFSGREIPDFVLTQEFHKNIKKRLYPKGKVLINYLREFEYEEKSKALEKLLKNFYKHVHSVDCFNNRFFLAA